MFCRSCGQENRKEALRCRGCGTPLSAPCRACGEPVRAGARFCNHCGAPQVADGGSPPLAPAEVLAATDELPVPRQNEAPEQEGLFVSAAVAGPAPDDPAPGVVEEPQEPVSLPEPEPEPEPEPPIERPVAPEAQVGADAVVPATEPVRWDQDEAADTVSAKKPWGIIAAALVVALLLAAGGAYAYYWHAKRSAAAPAGAVSPAPADGAVSVPAPTPAPAAPVAGGQEPAGDEVQPGAEPAAPLAVAPPEAASAPAAPAAQTPPAPKPAPAARAPRNGKPAVAPRSAEEERGLVDPVPGSAPPGAGADMPPPSAPVQDPMAPLRAAMGACMGESNFITRQFCIEKAKFAHCNGYWGQVPECPGNTKTYSDD